MGRRKKSVVDYEVEAARQPNGCLVHLSKTGGLVRRLYQLRHGRIPSAHVLVCHKCDEPRCIEDAHHFLGTQKDNMADMHSKGRAADMSGSRHPMYGVARADTSARNKERPPAKGHRQSPEHRRKLSEAQTKAWATYKERHG